MALDLSASDLITIVFFLPSETRNGRHFLWINTQSDFFLRFLKVIFSSLFISVADGKFILELARSKEGDRGGWVSVPRKTYWPPAAPSSNNNSVNHNKNESSTSLSCKYKFLWIALQTAQNVIPSISVSDDNSSIQSSPWQRDHCWKQPSPRRNISKELCLYYYRPAAIALHANCLRISKLKSRRPHDIKLSINRRVEYAKRNNSMASTSNEKTEKMDAVKIEGHTTVDTVDSGESSAKLNESNCEEEILDEKKSPTTRTASQESEMAIDDENSEGKLPAKRITLKRPKLNDILQKLIDRLAEQPQSVVGTQTGPGAGVLLSGGNGTSRTNDLGYYQQHVSPRKRILREFEKVSLEDAANTSSTKRSRSKGCNTSTASSDSSRTANGNRSANVTIDGAAKTTQSSILYPISQSNVTPTTSRPISSYSITSLLGHNSSSNATSSNSKLDNSQRTSPKSPQQPSTARMPKKKSPINGGSTSVGSPLGLTSSSFGSHRSPMNSPVNYGGRSTRSPDVNSPSPDHHHSVRNHAQRYTFGGTAASISSPTSGFHPYLPTSRASPLSGSAGALSPNTLDRYRTNYRAAASPSGTSSSSISGPSHAYASLNGSPNAHMMRYSPSTYGSNAQTSPPHQKSSPYKTNSLAPHAADTSNGNSIIPEGESKWLSAGYRLDTTPPSPPLRISKSSANNPITTSNNNTPSRTAPKKTASGATCTQDTKVAGANASHAKQPPPALPRLTAAELEHQAYLAAAAMHSRNASSPPLPPSAQPNPLHPFYMPYAAPPTHPNANVSQSMAAMAAAAYLNPLYYHPMTYSNPFRSPFWMPYQTAPNSNPVRSPSDPCPFPVRSLSGPRPFHGRSPPAEAPVDPAGSRINSNSISNSPWMESLHSSSASPPKTAFQRHTTRIGGEYDPYQSIREEQNSGKFIPSALLREFELNINIDFVSDVPLNLSKH